MSKFLRVGLIGCGERGAHFGLEIAKTSNARLVMVADADLALAQDFGERASVPWTTRIDELLDRDFVDAVIICTPHHLHAAHILQAANAGKHVMVEKPLGTTLQEAATAMRAANSAGVHLSTVFAYRYQAQIRRARELIAAGALGELFGVSLTFQNDKFSNYWRGGFTGRSTSDWRMRWETSGGGVLLASVIHFLDWLRYVPGVEVREVSAGYATFDSPGEVEDTICLWMRYANGALGTINASSCVRGTNLVEFRLWGRDGHISLAPPPHFYSLRLVDAKRPGQWHEFPEIRSQMRQDVEYVQRFAACVLRGESPEITGGDGLAAQAIAEAAYRSAQTGQAVRVEREPW